MAAVHSPTGEFSLSRRVLQHRARSTMGRAGQEGEGGDERRANQLKVRRLEDELQSLKDVYARKIANTELRCEQLLREKDDERSEWYKERKIEISKLQAGAVVMHAIFEKKRRRYSKQMEEDRAEFERQKASFHEQEERLRAQMREDLERSVRELAQRTAEYERQLSDLRGEKAAVEGHCAELEGRLAESGALIKTMEADGEQHRREIEDLKRRLVSAERTEELARKNAQIEALELELRRTKKVMQEQRFAEAEKLRKELMEYVKFIVHILPDDWQANFADGQEEGLPPAFRERLQLWPGRDEGAAAAAPGTEAPRSPQLGEAPSAPSAFFSASAPPGIDYAPPAGTRFVRAAKYSAAPVAPVPAPAGMAASPRRRRPF